MADTNTNQQNQGQEQEQEQEFNFDLNNINTWAEKNEIGLKFEDEGSLKNIFESYNKIGDYKKSVEDMQSKMESLAQYQEKYEMVLQKLNEGNILPDNETLALKQLKDKYPDYDLGLISNVRNSDLATMDKLEALILANKLEVKSNVSDDVRKRTILKQLGIEDTEDGFTDEDRFAIDNAFSNKKSLLEEIRGFQPETASFDFDNDYKTLLSEREAQTKAKSDAEEALKSHNQKYIEPIFDGFKEIKRFYKDEKGNEKEVKYAVDGEFKAQFIDEAVNELTKSGFKITPDNAQEVADMIEAEYRTKNFDRIMQMMAEQIIAQSEDDFHKRNHSDSNLNNNERPPIDVNGLPPTMKEQLRKLNSKN